MREPQGARDLSQSLQCWTLSHTPLTPETFHFVSLKQCSGSDFCSIFLELPRSAQGTIPCQGDTPGLWHAQVCTQSFVHLPSISLPPTAAFHATEHGLGYLSSCKPQIVPVPRQGTTVPRYLPDALCLHPYQPMASPAFLVPLLV